LDKCAARQLTVGIIAADQPDARGVGDKGGDLLPHLGCFGDQRRGDHAAGAAGSDVLGISGEGIMQLALLDRGVTVLTLFLKFLMLSGWKWVKRK